MTTPRLDRPGKKGESKTLEQHIRAGSYRPERHGEIPANLAEAIFGPPKVPPTVKPKGLGENGDWAWAFLCEHAAGLQPHDALQMEMICRTWSEYRRVMKRVEDVDPDAEPDAYHLLADRALKYLDRLERMTKSFGLSPAARMAMFKASNPRMANHQADASRSNGDDAEELPDTPKDPSLPVGTTRLDLFRPGGRATA